MHDDTADELGGAWGRKEHFPVGAPALLGRLMPRVSNRLVNVGTVSSAARIPFLSATSIDAMLSRS
jgi:hypothetical protein